MDTESVHSLNAIGMMYVNTVPKSYMVERVVSCWAILSLTLHFF